MDNLKPCPSCNSEDLMDGYVYVMCPKCGLQGPSTNGGRYDDHADFVDHENAIEFWNNLPRKTIHEENLRDKIGDLAHDQWSSWMEYLFSKCTFNEDGVGIIPIWAVERWKRQMKTPYAALTEEEKESDRIEADKFIKII